MSASAKTVSVVEFQSNYYPIEHWKHVSRFAVGDKTDPRGLFRLADDRWEAWPYAFNGGPTQAGKFRFQFRSLNTFLKLYVKWYCYQKLIGSAGDLRGSYSSLPPLLARADRYISEQGFRSIDDIAPSIVFHALWDAQIVGEHQDSRALTSNDVRIQAHTSAFWRHLRAEFGTPSIIPPIAPHRRAKPVELAADGSKIIPDHVVKQLTNQLSLHRRGIALLSRYDHLRLCVLVLAICLGRRIQEILSAPRGTGCDGPLFRRPSYAGPPEGALWFKFVPSKRGPADEVYISSRWEEVALYCVRELVRYGDEIRRLAVPEERGLLILVSRLNLLSGVGVRSKSYVEEMPIFSIDDPRVPRGGARNLVSGLSYSAFASWLNGNNFMEGILESWGITEDCTTGGPIYHFRTNYTRHTRQSAVALDPHVSLSTRQFDLNHRDPDTQFVYQHRLRENSDALLKKIKDGKLIGRGVECLLELLGVDVGASYPQPRLTPGRPSVLTPRLRALIKNNPMFMQLNRVPAGICILPQGPGGCAEYLSCVPAGGGGCYSFVVDVSDPQMLDELDSSAWKGRRRQLESASAGRLVQAQQRDEIARRTEVLGDAAMRSASEEVLASLREKQSEIEEEGL